VNVKVNWKIYPVNRGSSEVKVRVNKLSPLRVRTENPVGGVVTPVETKVPTVVLGQILGVFEHGILSVVVYFMK
jgi:hypothetical protein